MDRSYLEVPLPQVPLPLLAGYDPSAVVEPAIWDKQTYLRQEFIDRYGQSCVAFVLDSTRLDSTASVVIEGLTLFRKESRLQDAAARCNKVLPRDFQQNRARLCRRLAIAGKIFEQRILDLV
jgi:hypothetical protein